MDSETPIISDAFMRWIEEVFPELVPMSDNTADYFRAQGRKVVINRLRIENRKQSQ